MPSEEGQICRTITQKAMDMKNPCIQLTPVFPSTLDEWAKMYFFISKMTKEISERVGYPILVTVEESGGKNNNQCHVSKNGYHEMIKAENKVIENDAVMCIHCGYISPMSTKTEEELKKYFEKRNFINNKIIDRVDDSQY